MMKRLVLAGGSSMRLHPITLEVACRGEIAYQNTCIDREQLLVRAEAFGKTGYGQYLFTLAGEKR